MEIEIFLEDLLQLIGLGESCQCLECGTTVVNSRVSCPQCDNWLLGHFASRGNHFTQLYENPEALHFQQLFADFLDTWALDEVMTANPHLHTIAENLQRLADLLDQSAPDREEIPEIYAALVPSYLLIARSLENAKTPYANFTQGALA